MAGSWIITYLAYSNPQKAQNFFALFAVFEAVFLLAYRAGYGVIGVLCRDSIGISKLFGRIVLGTAFAPDKYYVDSKEQSS
ncbi:MAG: hypothetical protein LBL54_03820 [Clostridiales Family XIII bacterium]|jgi:hypothetical protein|nr:hypothetical protein [Clostridiales Family XIII bacterium]